MAKKRSVYNFLLGFTAGGIVASCIGIAGVSGLRYYENSALDKRDSIFSVYSDLVESCTGKEFQEDVARNLEKLQFLKEVGQIDEETYQYFYNLYNSEDYRKEHMLYKHEETYLNEILPLEYELKALNRNLPKLQKTRQITGVATLASTAITAYATAMFLNECEKQKEK